MTTIELARRVQLMRDSQKYYFKYRTGESLDEARRLERQVDRMLKQILEDRPAMLPFMEEDDI